jgi:hypothetical protein
VTARTAGFVIKTIAYDEMYDDADWHLMRLLGAGLVLLVLCLGGVYLYRRTALEEDQNVEYTRPITTDDSFEFITLDGSDPGSSLD